jgi:hypothetical protein
MHLVRAARRRRHRADKPPLRAVGVYTNANDDMPVGMPSEAG